MAPVSAGGPEVLGNTELRRGSRRASSQIQETWHLTHPERALERSARSPRRSIPHTDVASRRGRFPGRRYLFLHAAGDAMLRLRRWSTRTATASCRRSGRSPLARLRIVASSRCRHRSSAGRFAGISRVPRRVFPAPLPGIRSCHARVVTACSAATVVSNRQAGRQLIHHPPCAVRAFATLDAAMTHRCELHRRCREVPLKRSRGGDVFHRQLGEYLPTSTI